MLYIKLRNVIFYLVKKKYICVECIMYSQAGRLWQLTWRQTLRGQKTLKSSRKVGGYSTYCKIISGGSMCLLSNTRSLEKQSCGFILLAYSLQRRGIISSEFIGLSFPILKCCVSAYGALKLALKASIISCWPGFYLVCAVFLKIRNLYINPQIFNFSWHIGRSGNTELWTL